MPVYAGTSPDHLALALHSLEAQTVLPRAVLLVQDGELQADHVSVIALASQRSPVLRVLKPGAVGLVGALNAGIAATEATWIARMDADDVAEPTRLELQLNAVSDDIDVIGGAMTEFEDDPDHLGPRRIMPEHHADIVLAMRRLNPMNHPTVMMRRSAVQGVGGYRPLEGMEDYLLWATLASAGGRFRNLPQSLVKYRVNHESYQRRAKPAAVKAEWILQQQLRRLGLVGPARAAANFAIRVGFRLLPPFIMRPAYHVVRSTLSRRSSAAR